MGLSGARLPIGEDRGVVAFEAPSHQRERGAPIYLTIDGNVGIRDGNGVVLDVFLFAEE